MAAGYRRGFSHVFRLSSFDKEALCFNILDEIPEKGAYQYAFMIADILVSSYFQKSHFVSKNLFVYIRDFLTASILHCKCSDYINKSMYGVLSLLSHLDKENDNADISINIFDIMKNSCHCSNEIHDIIRNIIKKIKCLSKRKRQSVILHAVNSLNIFQDPVFQYATSSSDFCLNDFLSFDKPISLFIELNLQNNNSYFQYFIIVINMLYNLLFEDKNNNTNGFKNPVLILFDESLKDERSFKGSFDEYKNDIIIHYLKLNKIDKNNKSLGFLKNNNIKPVLKNRNDLLLECSNTTMPGQETEKWFNIPEEMYMMSEDAVINPVFTSTLPDDYNQDYESYFSDGKNKNESNYMELIRYDKIKDINLFFNDDLNEHVNKLENILRYKTFKRIKDRFIEKKQKCGFICMFFGDPGTGKTELVLQLAKKTKRDLLKVDLSEKKKNRVGDSEKVIKQMFSEYGEIYKNFKCTPILFINEADGFFQKRIGNVDNDANTTLALDQNTIQNMLLDKLENFEGIMIGTSNFIKNMDKALERRILYNVNFTKPDKKTQKKIWNIKLPDLDVNIIEKLVNNYDFTGGKINNVVKKMDIDYILSGEKPSYENIEKLCKMEGLDKKEIKVGFI
jgi:uncharacterized protein YihD (DUF1040 family)/archaellum biogenesis ATPase FlaH